MDKFNIKETILRNSDGKIIEHNITIPKADYDALIEDRREFLVHLQNGISELNDKIEQNCSGRDKESWLSYAMTQYRIIRDSVIQVCQNEIDKLNQIKNYGTKH